MYTRWYTECKYVGHDCGYPRFVIVVNLSHDFSEFIPIGGDARENQSVRQRAGKPEIVSSLLDLPYYMALELTGENGCRC